MSPTDWDIAVWGRHEQNLPVGPLTKDQAEAEDAYERYIQESLKDHEAEMQAGGRTICPNCGHRTVKHRTVCTYGRPGVEGSDHSDLAECENCDYKDLG